MQVLIGEYLDTWLAGLWLTVQLTAISFVASLVLGSVLATFRISPIAPLRVVGAVYVEIFRNVPLLALMILVTYGLPQIAFSLGGRTFDLNLGFRNAVLVSLISVGSAFACETIRTGINAVGVGQVEAARSIGLPFAGIIGHVVLPQAIRSVFGPLVSLFIGILLSSSLAGVVGVRELTATSSYINNLEAMGIATFAVAAIVYATISLGAAVVGNSLERRYRVLR